MNLQMDIDGERQAREIITPELQDGEQILWAGRPKQGIAFTPIDALLIPFGLIFTIFPLKGFALPTLHSLLHPQPGGPPPIFDLIPLFFTIPFIFVGLHAAFGRALRGMLWKRTAYYAVTDRRVIVVAGRGRQVFTRTIDPSMSIKKYLRSNGSGWLTFVDNDSGSFAPPPGIIFNFSQPFKQAFAFVDIPEAERVSGVLKGLIGGRKVTPISVPAHQDDGIGGPAEETPLPVTWGQRSLSPLDKLRLVCGNPIFIFGWVWFGFSMIFFWHFAAQANFTPLYFWIGTEVTPGRVVSMQDTGWIQSDGPGSGGHIIEYVYSYKTIDGRTHFGRCSSSATQLQKNTPIQVEYLTLWPARSLLLDVSGGEIPYFVGLLVIPFSVIGIILIIVSLRYGFLSIHLLQNGKPAYAILISKTKRRGEESSIYDLTFEFTSDSGQTHTVKTNTGDPTKLTDQRRELVLYHPNAPDKAQLLDSITGSPTIDFQGVIHLKKIWVGIFGFILALIITVIHGGIAWRTWGS